MDTNQENASDTAYQVGLFPIKLLGWIGFSFFVILAIGAAMAGQYLPSVCFLIFSLISGYMLLASGYFVVDSQFVTHQNIFGSYRLAWDEIKQIEIGASDGTLVLHGDNKRLVVLAPAMWSGEQKPAAFALLAKKLEATGITPYPSNTAAYKTHKNVRVQTK